MLMPTGPPAMKLTALADVSGSNEDEKMSIAKFLCVSNHNFANFVSSVLGCSNRKLLDHVHNQSLDLFHGRWSSQSV